MGENILTGDAKGTVFDKTRALLVLYLTRPDISSIDLRRLTNALRHIGGDVSGVSYLAEALSLRHGTAGESEAENSLWPSDASIMECVFGTGERILESGLRNARQLLQPAVELPICRIVDAFMDHTEDAGTASYAYFDPQQLSPNGTYVPLPRLRDPFKKAAVCILGGGSFVEMEAIQAWGKAHNKHITYVSTEMVSPIQFLEGITRL